VGDRFRDLSNVTQHQILAEVTVIRNAIAHNSGATWAKFLAQCPSGLPESRRSSTGLPYMTVRPSTNYGAPTTGLAGVANALGARSDGQAWKLMWPEGFRSAGEVALTGAFECPACGHVFQSVIRGLGLRVVSSQSRDSAESQAERDTKRVSSE
jgi:hypothetical protein